MKPLEFTAELESGVDEIDAQHRLLFELGNRVLAASEDASREVEEAVRFLNDYVEEHFAAEEWVMDRMDYDRSFLHKRQHANFRAELTTLRSRVNREGATRALKLQLHFMLADWFTHHIQYIDRRLAEHVRQSDPSLVSAMELLAHSEEADSGEIDPRKAVADAMPAGFDDE